MITILTINQYHISHWSACPPNSLGLRGRQACGLAKPTVTLCESKVKRERIAVNLRDQNKTRNVCALKSDFDHEHLKYVQLAVSPSVPIEVMAVPVKCGGSLISVFLDSWAAARVINLQMLKHLRKAERKHAVVLTPPSVHFTGLDGKKYPFLVKVLLFYPRQRSSTDYYHLLHNREFQNSRWHSLGIGRHD